jgi:membrane protease YdiL (CAAX protease family)
VEAPENPSPAEIIACSKCGSENPEAKRFCPHCGFPAALVYKLPVSAWQSIEPAIKAYAILFGVDLLFLSLKITPKSIHLEIEILIDLLFYSVVLFAVYPFRSKIFFLSRRFFNEYYSPLKMVPMAILTGAGIYLYFQLVEMLGVSTISYLEKTDLGTLRIPWAFISTVLLAPVFEEIFFRGYLFQKFRLVLKPGQTILLQGLLFGIIHLNPAMYISHTMMGILYGYFRYRTKSLLPGIVCHVLWNFCVVGAEYWRLTLN